MAVMIVKILRRGRRRRRRENDGNDVVMPFRKVWIINSTRKLVGKSASLIDALAEALNSPKKQNVTNQAYEASKEFEETDLTREGSLSDLFDAVPGQDEPHQPRHVGEGADLDLVDDVVGQVHGEQLGLGAENSGPESLCKEKEKIFVKCLEAAAFERDSSWLIRREKTGGKESGL